MENQPKIEWRDVIGYEGLYLIDADGQVYSARCNRMVRVSISRKEGAIVNLSKDGRRLPRAVHRLLAMAFLGMPHDVNVRHKDGNRLNNHLDNLEFTPKPKKRKFHTLATVDDFFWSNITWDWSDGCWEWQAAKNNAGYGSLSWNKKSTMAHRFSWMLHYGEISDGLVVMHKCDNPGCVNPAHLELGTHKDNIQDCIHKGRFRPFGRTPGEYLVPEHDEEIERQCKDCGRILPIENFHFHGRPRKDGSRYRRLICQDCHNENQREYWTRRGRFLKPHD